MAFLEQYDELAKSGDPAASARKQIALLQEWVVQRPDELFAELRTSRPVFVTPGPVVVSRYKDVVEVIDLDEIFSVAPYGQAMMRNNGGPNFILGMDRGPEFDHDLSVLKLAVKREDLETIRNIVSEETAALIKEALPTGKLDLTDGFSRLIAARLVARYFGVPGPNAQQLMNWTRAIFTDIFLNFTQDPSVAERGAKAGLEFRAYVDDLIAKTKADHAAGAPEKDDVLSRLVTMQRAPKASFTDSRLRDNLIGCITGVLDNTCTAVVNALNVLLSRPADLKGAVAAAVANDNEKLLRYVQEALRFHPPAPLMVRLSLADTKIAKGTPRETLIPAHKVVFAANGSAMMDETELENPREIRLDRPAHHYMIFGWGMHECLGKYVSQVQIVEIVKAVLALEGLRPAAGDAGKIGYEGAFAVRFGVEFNAASNLAKTAAASATSSTSNTATKGNTMNQGTSAASAQTPAAQPKQNPLTLIMTIKSKQDGAALRALLNKFLSMPRNQNPIDVALDKLAKVHFARFVFLDNDTRLAVITSYDDSFEDYINDFVNTIGDVFNALLAHMADAPPLPVQQNREAFLAYVRKNDLRCEGTFYSAYPTLGVKTILANAAAAE
jgi:cytochrome P450